MNIRKVIELSFLSSIMTIFSFIKFPGLIPGTEFQVSAPVAICICVIFGFKKYILAGIISSFLTLLIGTHNTINILNSFIFRIVAGGIIHFSSKDIFSISIAGPVGSIASRFLISILLNANFISILIPSIPGIIYTFMTAYPITRLFKKIIRKRWF